MNGTMDEPMDTSLPDSTKELNVMKDTNESFENSSNHCENSNNTEISNHLDSESSGGGLTHSNAEDSGNENSNDSGDHPQQPPKADLDSPVTTLEPEQENGCNIPVDSHCINSNESFPESTASSKEKSELGDHNEQQDELGDHNEQQDELGDHNEQQDELGDHNEQQDQLGDHHEQQDHDEQQDELGDHHEQKDELGDHHEKQENNVLESVSKDNDHASISNAHPEETDEGDSEDDSSDEGSEMSAVPQAEDTVSINSDSDVDGGDEISQEGTAKVKNTEVIIIQTDKVSDNHNGNSQDQHSPEIHEIESDNDDDDCVVAEDVKPVPKVSKKVDNKVQLRRSSRSIKRKRYNDDVGNGNESDIEEIELEDPLTRKKPIVVNDTKGLVEMASKQARFNHGNRQKKEPTVVIIDTHSILSGKSSNQQGKNSNVSSSSSLSAQHLYQSIVARGTTVTPVSSKSSTSSAASTQASQPPILPSLTDDMFVVEAPSFIVPYVYEKPSLKPFREFVDVLGKELEEQKAKEEKESLEKEKAEKEKKEKEKQEKKEKGEEVEQSEEEKDLPTESAKTEEVENEEEKRKKKEKKRARRNRANDDDDASWDGESSSDSDDDIISDEEGATIVIKDKADSIEEIKDVTDLTAEKASSGKSDNYFDCSLGKFFVNIGLNLVQEYVQNDLLKQQNRKLYREKKSGQNTRATETSIASLKKNVEFSKENNAPYSFPQKKCEQCSFKSESMLAMAHHLETPHMKNNVYKCNYCNFEIKSPHDILYHMEAEHNVRGKLERAPAYHQCANCPFEDNGKGKLARHLIPCAKKFKPEQNLAPPVEWEPPAKIPKIARSRNSMMSPYQSAFNRSVASTMGRPMSLSSMMGGVGSTYRARGRAPMGVPPRGAAIQGIPILRGGVMIRNTTPNQYNGKQKTTHQPSISITPLPRHAPPVLPQTPAQQSKSAFVICEICDGYIKDLEQLRNHMQWIHKVKIHPKMIYNRPPLNCQKCQFRFFTDQGLERHLLGSHGLVTSSMQEAANKGKDAGRCPVCGRVYQWKLLNHVSRDHNLTLKPAHLSYKCTVCTATFGMYKQFENHVYSAHSVVAKRVMDKTKAIPPTKSSDSLLKPLKINDEITIIPQPAKATSASSKDK